MGVNGPNLQDLFNQRFGAGSYEAGVNSAYNAGRSVWQAKQQAIQQQLFEQYQKQQDAAAAKAAAAQAKLQKPIDDQNNANAYWKQNMDSLLQKGAYRTVQDLQNDPELQAQLKSQGYDIKALADQAYNVATKGQVKSAAGFKDFYKSELDRQGIDSATQKANQQDLQNQIDNYNKIKKDYGLTDQQLEANDWKQMQQNGINQTMSAIGKNGLDTQQRQTQMYNDAARKSIANSGVGSFGDELQRGIARGANSLFLGLPGQLYSKLNNGEQSQMLMDRHGSAGNLDKATDFLGTAIPFALTDGATGALGLGAGLAEKGVAGKIAQTALRGAVSGGVVNAGEQGVRYGFNPDQFNAGDAAKELGMNALYGAGGGAALHGAGSLLGHLNLKGQLNKVLDSAGGTPFNANEFQKAWQDAAPLSSDLKPNFGQSNAPQARKLIGDITLPGNQSEAVGNVANQILNKKPVDVSNNNWFSANTLKENPMVNFAQRGSTLPGRGMLQDLSVPKAQSGAIRSLAEDALNKANSFSNSPAEGFNQRLLDVQQEMKGLQNNAQALADHHGGSYAPNVEDLYQQVRKPNDPKSFDDLVKMVQMEQGATTAPSKTLGPNVKQVLESDPRFTQQVKQHLNALDALGKPSEKVAPKVEAPTPSAKQTPKDLMQGLYTDRGAKPKAEVPIPKVNGKSGVSNNLLLSAKVTPLKSIKTSKLVETMNTSELHDVMAKLDKQEELLSKGGKGSEAKLKAVQEDKQKVSDLLMKLDLQQHGANANPLKAVQEKITGKAPEKTPQDIAKEKAIARAKQEAAVKKFEDAGNARKAEAAKMIENSANWKDKSAFSYGRETMARNFEDTMGKDAPGMIKRYIEPIKKGEADRIRFVNQEREGIKDLNIKPGSKDDKLVQMYGEGKVSKDEVMQQAKNPENVLKAADYMRKKYDELLPMINKVLKANGDKEIPFRKDYFPHYEEIDGIMHQLGFDMTNHSLPTDINGLTENFRPSKNWTSFSQRRTGDETSYGFIQGFDKYIEGASNLIYHTKNIKDMRALEDAIREVHSGGTHLSNFAAQVKEFTNQLAGKKSTIDRSLENAFGRKVFNYLDTLKRKTGMNMVGANVGSAMTNFIPLTQSLATTSKPAFLKGMAETMANIGKNDGFAAKSDFLTKREGTSTLYKTWAEKATNKSMYLMKVVDDFSSNVIVRSKYNEGISKGLSEEEAMKQADAWAEKIMAGRAKGDVPTLMNSKTLGLFSQFQLEVNNQVSFLLKDIPHNATSKMQLASQIGQVILYGYLFNNLYEKATGRRPAIDPIGIAKQAFTDYNNPRLKKGTATQNLISNIAGTVPMGDLLASTAGLSSKTSRIPMGSAIPNIANIVSGKSSVSTELLKPLTYLVSPTGGGAIKKAVEGVSAYNKGGVYNGKGQLQYPVQQNAANAVRGALFGKSSFPEANAYYNNNESALSDNQTKQVETGARSYQSILQERHNADIMKKIKEIRKNGGDPNKIAKLMSQIKH